MQHNPCANCGMPNTNRAFNVYCTTCESTMKQGFSGDYLGMFDKAQKHITPNRDNTVQPPPEPTVLTRDQAIRAKALELAIALFAQIRNEGRGLDLLDTSEEFEDYIRGGRKGDE